MSCSHTRCSSKQFRVIETYTQSLEKVSLQTFLKLLLIIKGAKSCSQRWAKYVAINLLIFMILVALQSDGVSLLAK